MKIAESVTPCASRRNPSSRWRAGSSGRGDLGSSRPSSLNCCRPVACGSFGPSYWPSPAGRQELLPATFLQQRPLIVEPFLLDLPDGQPPGLAQLASRPLEPQPRHSHRSNANASADKVEAVIAGVEASWP